MSWGGPCIWRRTQDAPSSTLARTHQGRRKQFPIQKQLVSFLLASSQSAPASIRNTNSLRSLNEPICHRRRVLFVREGGGLDPDLSAPNNYIKVRLHWEATSQDNKKRKERPSESSQVWGSAALLRGQLPPSRSLLFRHPSFTHPTLCWAAIWEAPACTGAPCHPSAGRRGRGENSHNTAPYRLCWVGKGARRGHGGVQMSSGKDGILPHDLSPTRKLQTTATKGRLDGDAQIYNFCASKY